MQTSELQRRENQYAEAQRDYRERVELLKVEQERIALKEQQFLRQVHKLEGDLRKETARLTERHNAQLTVKTREWERTIEEIEERYVRTQDENEDLRRKITNLERSLHELRQHAGDHDKRE